MTACVEDVQIRVTSRLPSTRTALHARPHCPARSPALPCTLARTALPARPHCPARSPALHAAHPHCAPFTRTARRSPALQASFVLHSVGTAQEKPGYRRHSAFSFYKKIIIPRPGYLCFRDIPAGYFIISCGKNVVCAALKRQDCKFENCRTQEKFRTPVPHGA